MEILTAHTTKDLKALLKERSPEKRRAISERGELLAYFRDGVNAGRDGKKYKKVTIGYIAMKVQGLELRDLYYMRSVLEDTRRRGGNFGKVFFGMLKTRVKLCDNMAD